MDGTHGLSPSRLPLRAHFHRERDVWVRGRHDFVRVRQGGLVGKLVGRSSNLPAGGENRARKWIILPCFSYSFYTFLNEKYVSHIIQSLKTKQDYERCCEHYQVFFTSVFKNSFPQ